MAIIRKGRIRDHDWVVRRDGIVVSAHPSWLEATRGASELLDKAGAAEALAAWEACCNPYYGLHNKPASTTIMYADRSGQSCKLEVCQHHPFNFGDVAFDPQFAELFRTDDEEPDP